MILMLLTCFTRQNQEMEMKLVTPEQPSHGPHGSYSKTKHVGYRWVAQDVVLEII